VLQKFCNAQTPNNHKLICKNEALIFANLSFMFFKKMWLWVYVKSKYTNSTANIYKCLLLLLLFMTKQYHMCTCHLIVKLAYVSSLKHYKLLNINILRSTLSVSVFDRNQYCTMLDSLKLDCIGNFRPSNVMYVSCIYSTVNVKLSKSREWHLWFTRHFVNNVLRILINAKKSY